MISQELGQLLELQRIDLALDDADRRESEEKARLKQAQESVESARNKAKETKKAVDDLLKERKALELEFQGRDNQIKKYNSQLYEVKTNKEYTALKDEIEKNKAEGKVLEDRILQLMLREDEMKGATGRMNAEVAGVEKTAREAEVSVADALKRITEEREALVSSRGEHAAKLGKSLLDRYERIRRNRGGSPLSKIVEGPGGSDMTCQECYMTIRPQIIVELHKQEELITCESCGRILYMEIQPSSIGTVN